jgi:di/tricarboxylate transporter
MAIAGSTLSGCVIRHGDSLWCRPTICPSAHGENVDLVHLKSQSPAYRRRAPVAILTLVIIIIAAALRDANCRAGITGVAGMHSNVSTAKFAHGAIDGNVVGADLRCWQGKDWKMPHRAADCRHVAAAAQHALPLWLIIVVYSSGHPCLTFHDQQMPLYHDATRGSSALPSKTGVDVRSLLVVVMFGASASFATPAGYQTNTLVYAAGTTGFRILFDWATIEYWGRFGGLRGDLPCFYCAPGVKASSR